MNKMVAQVLNLGRSDPKALCPVSSQSKEATLVFQEGWARSWACRRKKKARFTDNPRCYRRNLQADCKGQGKLDLLGLCPSVQLPLGRARVWALSSPGCRRAGDVVPSTSEETGAGSAASGWFGPWLWWAVRLPNCLFSSRSTAMGYLGC